MNLEELNLKIFHQCKYLNPQDRVFWQNVKFATTLINNSIQLFNDEENPILAVGYAKLFIMELWTLRELFVELGLPTQKLDILVPDLKLMRDAYAHIKERLQGSEKPFKSPPKRLLHEKYSAAGGKLKSKDGKNWHMGGGGSTRIFNCTFSGNEGFMSVFGIVDDFLICNSSNGLLEVQINHDLSEEILAFVADSLV